ncbi:uncharacterized protein [Clytia hemisphaerica]|uniref:uncharacterized protein n=1 Tax=Clytia hemisphaerica TaxID=252671 RepID=UPI0034D53B3F
MSSQDLFESGNEENISPPMTTAKTTKPTKENLSPPMTTTKTTTNAAKRTARTLEYKDPPEQNIDPFLEEIDRTITLTQRANTERQQQKVSHQAVQEYKWHTLQAISTNNQIMQLTRHRNKETVPIGLIPTVTSKVTNQLNTDHRKQWDKILTKAAHELRDVLIEHHTSKKEYHKGLRELAREKLSDENLKTVNEEIQKQRRTPPPTENKRPNNKRRHSHHDDQQQESKK